MICYRYEKTFSENELTALFHSVGWDIDTPSEVLIKAMSNSTNIVSAWDGERLVGVIRSMDDGCWSANIDCLVVHRDYQNKGIGTVLVKELLQKIGHIMNISVCPNEAKNIAFYQKLGFNLIEGSRLLQMYS